MQVSFHEERNFESKFTAGKKKEARSTPFHFFFISESTSQSTNKKLPTSQTSYLCASTARRTSSLYFEICSGSTASTTGQKKTETIMTRETSLRSRWIWRAWYQENIRTSENHKRGKENYNFENITERIRCKRKLCAIWFLSQGIKKVVFSKTSPHFHWPMVLGIAGFS